ncbi:MAG: hypothetical protein GOU99_00005, partial [Candidatus Altiarchaeota archaeon]|nr:hypothetical protein [Candidatus Altiarchaeota archaeon]
GSNPIIGKCPDCGDEVMSLISMRDKRYAKCKKCGKSWGLPQRGKLTITKEKCKKCKLHLIHIDRGSTKFKLCIEHGFY